MAAPYRLMASTANIHRSCSRRTQVVMAALCTLALLPRLHDDGVPKIRKRDADGKNDPRALHSCWRVRTSFLDGALQPAKRYAGDWEWYSTVQGQIMAYRRTLRLLGSPPWPHALGVWPATKRIIRPTCSDRGNKPVSSEMQHSCTEPP